MDASFLSILLTNNFCNIFRNYYNLKVNNAFQGGTSFVDPLCYLCLVFLMLLRLFIAAL